MVSFSCEVCGDVLTKKKLDPHRSRCRGATFTCIDCMVHFQGTDYRAHTSCITEDQKYQGSLYKDKKGKAAGAGAVVAGPSTTSTKSMAAAAAVMPPHKAYVEEVEEEEERFNYADYEIHDDDDDDSKSTADLPPEAPTPPPAAGDGSASGPVNVFDFLVNATPNASTVGGPSASGPPEISDDTTLVRFDYEANAYLDPTGFMADDEELVQYGTGPIPNYRTPAPRDRKKAHHHHHHTAASTNGETPAATTTVKKDKKRKRLHVDVPSPLGTDMAPGDMVMTDAPPVLQTGLSAGINRMMRPVFPPSPDYSGGDVADVSPSSPLKKTKHSRQHKSRGTASEATAPSIGNNLMALITTGTRPKTKKRKEASTSGSTTGAPTIKKHHHHKRLEGAKQPKLIEYKPAASASGDEAGREKVAETSQLVVFRPRANLLLSYVNKGPDSEKGCSMNKVLKRYHRDRAAADGSAPKATEEKELWRSLRMRRNDRGEIVLFTA